MARSYNRRGRPTTHLDHDVDTMDFRNSRRATQMRTKTAGALRGNPVSRIWSAGSTAKANIPASRYQPRLRFSRSRLGTLSETAQRQLTRNQVNNQANKDISFINGRAVGFSRQPMRFQITKTVEQLRLQNYLVVSNGNPSIDSMAQSVINSCSIRATRQKRNFTLINSQNDNETIQNPAIVDPDINSLTPDPIEAKDKFQNPCDPFYNADDNRTEAQRVIYEKLTQVPQIGVAFLAKSLSIKNLSATKRKNKFFVDIRAYQRSAY